MHMVWDEAKRERNLLPEPDGHGMDFVDARDRFEWDTALVLATYSGPHGGERRVAIGFLDEDLVTLVFAPLGMEAVSAISLRPASNRERRRYAQG